MAILHRAPAPGPDDGEADLWAAVRDRSAAADGRFVYGVRTTGVYCRPSCPSRRPHRANVRFHPTAAAAEAAGFRPCKRCRPERAAAEPHRSAAP